MTRFIKSASNQSQWILDDITEVCFLGRSNVGKSSLINALANNKIAKTSKTPGRTQLVNFYDFQNFRIVDLPGYGFAKTSKIIQNNLSSMINEYLLARTNLYAVFQICDAGVITNEDQKYTQLIQSKFKNYFIVLNKIDKYSKQEIKQQLTKVNKFLNVDDKRILVISAKNKTNIQKLFQMITNTVQKVN